MSDASLLERLGLVDREAFMHRFGDIAEHTTWVAERAYELRPFSRPADLHAALMRVISAASREEQLALIRAHPELAGKEAEAGTMTDSSTTEQGRLGLNRLDAASARRFADLNRQYRARFDMPCIIALRLQSDLPGLLDTFEARLKNDPDTEIKKAIGEIGHILRGRLGQRLSVEIED